jgi:hypothetical protein
MQDSLQLSATDMVDVKNKEIPAIEDARYSSFQ